MPLAILKKLGRPSGSDSSHTATCAPIKLWWHASAGQLALEPHLHIIRRYHRSLLLRIGNLLVCKSTLLQGILLQNQGYVTGKLSLKME
jgi:hypothetical protein